MKSVDVISQICVHCEYPLYRQLLTKYRSKFNKIILYPSRHHGVIDCEDFLKRVFPETWVTNHTIDWTTPNIDWRQAETEPCLELSDSDWILFMEQDFFVDNWDKLFEALEFTMKRADLIGWWNQTNFSYMHPCFLLIKRELLEKTKKDFRAHPEIPGCDHFAMITHQAQELNARIITLQGLGYREWEDAFHMGGLTYPMQNWKGDGSDVFGVANPESYYSYLYWTRQAPVEQFPPYIDLSLKIEARLKELFPIFKPDSNRWIKFFKI